MNNVYVVRLQQNVPKDERITGDDDDDDDGAANEQERSIAASSPSKGSDKENGNCNRNYKSNDSLFIFREDYDFMTLASSLQNEFVKGNQREKLKSSTALDFSALDVILSNHEKMTRLRNTMPLSLTGGYHFSETPVADEEKSFELTDNDADQVGVSADLAAQQYSIFLQEMLENPEVRSSKAMADFFTVSSEPQTSDKSLQIGDEGCDVSANISCGAELRGNLHQYFFEDDDDFIRIDLSRRGTNSSTYTHMENISHGSYLLWRFRIKPGIGIGMLHPIQFRLLVSGDDLGSSQQIAPDFSSSDNFDAVHERDIKWSTRDDGAIIEGLYRFRHKCRLNDEDEQISPSSAFRSGKVMLYFVNNNIARHAIVLLNVEVVSNEVIDVARLAVDEEMDRYKNRQRAPLLNEVLKSTKDMKSVIIVESLDNGDDQLNAGKSLGPNFELMKKYKLETDREQLSRIRAEKKVHYLQQEICNLREQIERHDAEKRIFNMAKRSFQAEVLETTEKLAQERKSRHACQQEISILKENLKMEKEENDTLRKQILRQKNIERLKEELVSLKTEYGESLHRNSMLEEKIVEVNRERDLLSSTLDDERLRHKQICVSARAEVDEAKMMQRILEGQIRALEKTSASPKKLKQSSTVEKGHVNDEKLKKQLVGLKARHEKLTDLLENDPDNEKYLSLISKLEIAIQNIIVVTSERSESA
mmetsp:Transcript_14791/g.19305  ORF Transcript_14791/g.19305 Transcript_14791/m.19305 type:complete len:704 (-) Transcript_14791:54-2165(-)|eukprot:CAMPEP_0116064132 /NCGR_PEP_ID=MMETSP0322-20121206/8897_1 /TAXON_ID=163516 /ORGANISM="Leptocylindrus danicus var. apora, Strain B651" /LENGTH=703 /DNA_ID=CAMNT_0003550021 /DNA_START=146 /DNA_END=2257 /DNA_ORIENTATION=-